MIRFVVDWFVLTLSVGLAAWFLPGVHIESVSALLWAGTALGFVNVVIRPIFSWLTLPIRFVTLGLFTFVLNGAAFYLATIFVPGFSLAGRSFLWAMAGALFVSVVSWILGDLGYRRQRKKWAEERTRSTPRVSRSSTRTTRDNIGS
ncbi:MAG: phage holin family protein [Myxococcota bacterium]